MKIAIIGAGGRMGRTIAITAREKGIDISGACERKDQKGLGEDYGTLVFNQKIGVILTDSLREAMEKSDVGIEFTSREATIRHLREMETIGKPYVVGTTGFEKEDFSIFERVSKKLPLFWSPNMSFGVYVLSYVVEETAKLLPDWDFEIMEIHHTQKKDAPSGTAKILAEKLKNGKGEVKLVLGREGEKLREKNEIGVFALRMGDIKGEHRVFGASSGERIELSHIAYDRSIFALGAFKAAEFLLNKSSGFYKMQDLFKK